MFWKLLVYSCQKTSQNQFSLLVLLWIACLRVLHNWPEGTPATQDVGGDVYWIQSETQPDITSSDLVILSDRRLGACQHSGKNRVSLAH